MSVLLPLFLWQRRTPSLAHVFGSHACERAFSTQTVTTPVPGKSNVEELWREFFSDPSEWWDHRSDKCNTRYPDFKHKKTGVALWINGRRNPTWVGAELAALTSGCVPRSPYSWNTRLARSVNSAKSEVAFDIFQQMIAGRVEPDSFTFVLVTNACSNLVSLEKGRIVHAEVVKSGCQSDIRVGNCLVDMYAKCRSMEDAQKVFDGMALRDVVSWTSIICGYVKCEQARRALELFKQMQIEGLNPNIVTFAMVLNACAGLAVLDEGRLVHSLVLQFGYESDLRVGNCLVNMYAKCGSIDEALRVFEKMPTRDVVSWTSMIAGYVKCELGRDALELYQRMQAEGLKPNSVTFSAVLSACVSVGDLEEGRLIHAQLIQSGWESDVRLGNCLADMYAKCGRIQDARKVFDKMPIRNAVSWGSMFVGYVKCEQSHKALELYQYMQAECVKPDNVTFATLLNACAALRKLEEGRHIHLQVVQSGFESDIFVSSSLVDMYAKCGSIEEAQTVFHRMPTRDLVSWTVMLMGYVKCGVGHKALELYALMEAEGIKPNIATFATVLHACATTRALQEGRRVHAQVIHSGCQADLRVGNCLIDMYAKCGSIEDARSVFNRMPQRDVVSWTAMLVGYVKFDQGQKALELYPQMQAEGVRPNTVTFAVVLNACARSSALEEGMRIHAQVIEDGCEADVRVGNCLLDMYAKCGSADSAWRVFNKMPVRDVVSWTAMLVGYVKCEQGQKALDLYQRMQAEGVKSNAVTFAAVLNACASLAALNEGRTVHSQIIESGFELDLLVGNSLVDMYGKCGSMKDAQRVFSQMPTRDIVSWTAMLWSLALHGHGKEAVELFEEMCQHGVGMNSVTFVCLLSACSHAGLVDEGLCYFQSMRSVYGVSPAAEHYVCIVDILGRAGRLDEAENTIKMMIQGEPNINSCHHIITALRAMLGACSKYGNLEIGIRVAKKVLELDPDDAAGYVLLSNIYAAAGQWDRSNKIQQIRKEGM